MANPRFQVIVIGCTEWAFTFAVRARRLGLTVAMLMDRKHVGGFTSGGLQATDIGKPGRRNRGIYREHYQRCGRMIGLTGNRNPEPNVAERAYLAMLGEAGVRIYTGCQVNTVAADAGTRTVTLTMVDGRAFDCTLPFDATTCMDVLQRMGTRGTHWTIGREAAAATGEALAGANRFTLVRNASPYIPGTTTLLPSISPKPTTTEVGGADDNVQDYCIREVHSYDPTDRIPYDKMKIGGVLVQDMGYDRANHLFNAPAANAIWFASGIGPGKFTRNGDVMLLDPDGKPTHRRYALMSYAERAAYEARLKLQQMQQLYFNLTDPSLAGTDVRAVIETCGLPRSEFRDNNYFAYEVYPRETIRPIGGYVMKQTDTQVTDTSAARNVFKADGGSIGGYSLDQHSSIFFQEGNTWVKDAVFQDFDARQTYSQGYSIPMRSLYHPDLPLLFGYPSCTHVAWSSIRIVLNLCLAAEASAHMAYQYVVNGTPLAQIDPAAIRAQLTALGLYVDPIPVNVDPDDPTDPTDDPDVGDDGSDGDDDDSGDTSDAAVTAATVDA